MNVFRPPASSMTLMAGEVFGKMPGKPSSLINHANLSPRYDLSHKRLFVINPNRCINPRGRRHARITYPRGIIDHFEYLQLGEKWINIKSLSVDLGGGKGRKNVREMKRKIRFVVEAKAEPAFD